MLRTTLILLLLFTSPAHAGFLKRLDTPIEITGLTHDGTWRNVDLTSFLTNSNVGAVVIKIHTQASGNKLAGVAPYAQGTNSWRSAGTANMFNMGMVIPLDSQDRIDYYSQTVNSLNNNFYIVGEILKDDDIVWFATPINTAETASVWTDNTVISTSQDSAAAAIVNVVTIGAGSFGLRPNGSNYSFYAANSVGDKWGAIVGVDKNNIFEQMTTAVANSQFFIMGYIRRQSNWVANPNPSEIGATGLTLGAFNDVALLRNAGKAKSAWLNFNTGTKGGGTGYIRNDGSTEAADNIVTGGTLGYPLSMKDFYKSIFEYLPIDSGGGTTPNVYAVFGYESYPNIVLDGNTMSINAEKVVIK